MKEQEFYDYFLSRAISWHKANFWNGEIWPHILISSQIYMRATLIAQ